MLNMSSIQGYFMGKICANCLNQVHCENTKLCDCNVCNDHDSE
jgi:hypothetical protein